MTAPLISLRRLLPIVLIAFALSNVKCTQERHTAAADTTSTLRYARGFAIKKLNPGYAVTVTNPYPGAQQQYQYLLIPRGSEVPAHDATVQVIRTPVQRIVCTSTTHIPLLEYIGHGDALVGFPTTDYISSPTMRQRIDSGRVAELGIDKGMNIEKLFALKPDVVMGYTLSSDLGQLKKIESLGIPVLINAEYLERHPLGRAEWIQLMAVLFDETPRADSVFQTIESAYLSTRQLAHNATTKPAVLSGILYGNSWFLPGGQNYAATLLADAGCNYLWAQDNSTGFLELDFEHVFSKAAQADLWIGTGSYESRVELGAADRRYKLFAPFQRGDLYHYNGRMGARGGNEFLELGYLRPDLILKDLVRIAHPELLPEHELYFHRRLK